MKYILILFVTICVWASAAGSSFCDEKPGVQATAKLVTQIKVQMGYLLYLSIVQDVCEGN